MQHREEPEPEEPPWPDSAGTGLTGFSAGLTLPTFDFSTVFMTIYF